MRHVNKRFRKWAIRDMQRHSVGGALHAAKSPQDYSNAKRIGVNPCAASAIIPGDLSRN